MVSQLLKHSRKSISHLSYVETSPLTLPIRKEGPKLCCRKSEV